MYGDGAMRVAMSVFVLFTVIFIGKPDRSLALSAANSCMGGQGKVSSAPGTVCADGTVYAGLSRREPMYVTRCDAGMRWTASACAGKRANLPWNNGKTGRGSAGLVDTPVANDASTGGKANTTILVATDADSVVKGKQNHMAAQYCHDLSIDGHSDWYLPSKGELNTIYTNSHAIGNFDTSGSYYWSSSELAAGSAWGQRFSDGAQSYMYKWTAQAVRCVRN